eukprot:225777-Chlamydomonas_euryale.AAC.1
MPAARAGARAPARTALPACCPPCPPPSRALKQDWQLLAPLSVLLAQPRRQQGRRRRRRRAGWASCHFWTTPCCRWGLPQGRRTARLSRAD